MTDLNGEQGGLRSMVRRRVEKLRLVSRALRISRAHSEHYAGVATYLMFVGHPRSGHTLVKALLNAHKHVVIGQEVNILRYLLPGFSRWMLFSMILASDQWFHGSGRVWGEYSYRVPNQWQGRYEQLRVIGDKKAGNSTNQLTKKPGLVSRLQQRIDVPIKLFFVVRNPYDNIATISRKHHASVPECIAQYFTRSRTVRALRDTYPDIPMLTLFLERIVEDPQASLRQMLDFLDLDADAQYLADCAGIVFSSPNLSRHSIEWTRAQVDEVRERMGEFDHLDGYTFEA